MRRPAFRVDVSVADTSTHRGDAMGDSNTSDAGSEPIPIDLCRQLLASEPEGLSDDEVELIRRHANDLAHVLIEIAGQRQLEG